MTVLVTGANGQVGWEVAQRGGTAVTALDRLALDITDATAVAATLDRDPPTVVVNCAAYTAVDRAETESELAFAVNRDGPAVLARACAERGIPLLHLSTDYVFDGARPAPWRESDQPAPLGVYGQSKWEGEEAVRQHCAQHLILRVSWVFGAHGHNFVRTMVRLGRERETLGVVADQHGCPTWAGHIAGLLLRLCDRIAAGEALPWGTYHYCGVPATTWHGFAEAIFAEAEAAGLIARRPTVNPIGTADYPTPARRPANSVLDCSALEQQLGEHPEEWRAGLRAVMEQWKQEHS